MGIPFWFCHIEQKCICKQFIFTFVFPFNCVSNPICSTDFRWKKTFQRKREYCEFRAMFERTKVAKSLSSYTVSLHHSISQNVTAKRSSCIWSQDTKNLFKEFRIRIADSHRFIKLSSMWLECPSNATAHMAGMHSQVAHIDIDIACLYRCKIVKLSNCAI